MTKNDVVSKKMNGATKISDTKEGRGNTLKFISIPDQLWGSFISEISCFKDNESHPLNGAVYQIEDDPVHETFSITIFQNDCKGYIAQVFANLFMGHNHIYMQYADDDTKFKIETAKQVPA